MMPATIGTTIAAPIAIQKRVRLGVAASIRNAKGAADALMTCDMSGSFQGLVRKRLATAQQIMPRRICQLRFHSLAFPMRPFEIPCVCEKLLHLRAPERLDYGNLRSLVI